MRKITSRVLWVAMLSLISSAALADGHVTTANPNPVDTWKIVDVRFSHLASEQPAAIIAVGYFRTDDTQDHVAEQAFTGSEYGSLLVAINTPSGADEATILKPGGGLDLSAIFRLRISRWMILHNKIDGVTAEPLIEDSGS